MPPNAPVPRLVLPPIVRRVAALCLAVGLVGGCAPPPTDERALKDQLQGMAEAVEDRDASEVADSLADDFSGPGNMDKDRAQAYASVLMARYSALSVTWTLKSIDVQGDRARTDLTAVLAGRAMVAGFEGRGRLMDVSLGWRRDQGEWKIVHARWQGALETR